MSVTCYGCRHLMQGGDGSNGCLEFGDPNNSVEAYHLGNPPEPLYDDCYEEIEF